MEDRVKNFVVNAIADTAATAEKTLEGIRFGRFFARTLENQVRQGGLRVCIVAGLRGTGKTTALYQLLGKNADAAFFSCDELRSLDMRLEDVMEALDVIKKEKVGVEKKFLLLLDEVTYLQDWDLKLKILHDKRPNLRIAATSSSALPLKKTLELTRRSAEILALPLSFREYLILKHGITVSDGLSSRIRAKVMAREALETEYLEVRALAGNRSLLGLFEEYLERDMPHSLVLDEGEYAATVNAIVKRTIYEDFAKYGNLETRLLTAAEILLKYLASVPSDGVKITTLCEVTGLSSESVTKLLKLLENALLIRGVESEGRNRSFKKPRKWFFYSPSMRNILATPVSSPQNRAGNLREDAAFLHLSAITSDIHYSHDADLISGKARFEIGGKKKARPGTTMLDMSEETDPSKLGLPVFALSA